MPTLFMVEVVVREVAASRAWYEGALGMKVVMSDAKTGFVLLQDAGGGRVALKPGGPAAGGVTLHFEVSDVGEAARGLTADGPVEVSAEGYREVFVRDPDGYRVGLFAWDRAPDTPPAARG